MGFTGGQGKGRWIMQGSFNDFLGLVDTGLFIWFGLRQINSSEVNTQSIFPFAATLQSFAVEVAGNSLDPATTNTMTVRKEASDTTFVWSIASGIVGTIIEIGNEPFAAGDRVIVRWDTDTVGGTISMKGLAAGGRA